MARIVRHKLNAFLEKGYLLKGYLSEARPRLGYFSARFTSTNIVQFGFNELRSLFDTKLGLRRVRTSESRRLSWERNYSNYIVRR